jgi:hypothetical protein
MAVWGELSSLAWMMQGFRSTGFKKISREASGEQSQLVLDCFSGY